VNKKEQSPFLFFFWSGQEKPKGKVLLTSKKKIQKQLTFFNAIE